MVEYKFSVGAAGVVITYLAAEQPLPGQLLRETLGVPLQQCILRCSDFGFFHILRYNNASLTP
jgi:hypothetical protein